MPTLTPQTTPTDRHIWQSHGASGYGTLYWDSRTGRVRLPLLVKSFTAVAAVELQRRHTRRAADEDVAERLAALEGGELALEEPGFLMRWNSPTCPCVPFAIAIYIYM